MMEKSESLHEFRFDLSEACLKVTRTVPLSDSHPLVSLKVSKTVFISTF